MDEIVVPKRFHEITISFSIGFFRICGDDESGDLRMNVPQGAKKKVFLQMQLQDCLCCWVSSSENGATPKTLEMDG